MTRLQPHQLAQLDSWIAKQDDPKLTRPEAVRRLMMVGLAESMLNDGKAAG
jgi:hypothetical protein